MSGLSLVDVGLEWFKDAIAAITDWFASGLADGYDTLTEALFGTPTPQTEDGFVFGTPTNEPWIGIHESLVGGEIQLLAFLILLICVQTRHALRIFNVGNAVQMRRAVMNGWLGAFLIVLWYWIGALSLYLVDAFTLALIPNMNELTTSMTGFLAVTITNPGLGLLVSVVGGVAMWILQALLFLREILLYIYLFAMPIGIAVAFGRVPVLSRLSRALCVNFVPLAILPIPVALLFRGYHLLFSGGARATVAPDRAFLSYLLAVSLPLVSLLVVWKLFRVGAPLTGRVLGRTIGTAATAGVVITAGSVAGPAAATTAARWGSKAAAGQTLANRAADIRASTSDDTSADSKRSGDTASNGAASSPSYRRTGNNPKYR